jgi:GR25 family glycosyltransferase involved in LPS biosynthesis
MIKKASLFYSLAALFMLFLAIKIIKHQMLLRKPHVKDIWIINLEEDKDRMESINAQTAHISDITHRWPATVGKELVRETIRKEGVGYAMTRTGDQTQDKAGVLRNAGVVGCFLSHKRLLQHLATLKVPEYYGHLILEDDVTMPADFLKPGDAWHGLYKLIPNNWDVIYFGITEPVGKPVAPGILKARTAHNGKGNWGTHAYMVRHGSIPKILKHLEYMNDAIDEQYNLKFDTWNVYVLHPALITPHETLSKNSSLLKMNVGADDSTRISY